MEYYNSDSRLASVMIEVNRSLYMSAPGVKNGDFDKIRKLLCDCVSRAAAMI